MMQPSILKSHKHSKMIEPIFYRLHSIMVGSKIIADSQSESMTPNFVVVVYVLPPICCHIGWGIPYLYIFVEEVVTLLGAITEKWV